MSDDYLQFIPQDPYRLPEPEAQQAAVQLLRGLLPQAESISVQISEHPQFVDAGSNFEAVRCPFCSTVVLEWWQDAMDQAYADHFSQLAVTLPCCGRATSLNDLDYSWPQGFARCILRVHNPGRSAFDSSEVMLVATALGGSLRMIWTHR